MAPEITPDEIRNAQFRTTLRGLDRGEVETMLRLVAARIEELEGERKGLLDQIAEGSASHELASEFESVGNEVTAILQAAREAAESMRERASLDAARWRREATEDAETNRRDAAADAEAMRRDAWVTGSELLEQARAGSEEMRATAERDVLTVMGEAEREAHRLTSGARRDAEDLLRNAAMDAEKVSADAVRRRDEIIDGANRQASAAQERARALELRRNELLEELENVRSTLTRLEGSLAERREALDVSRTPEPSNVRVVHPPVEGRNQWELGETVRVVPADDGEKGERNYELADEEAGNKAGQRLESVVSEEPQTEPDPTREPDSEPTGVDGRAEEPPPPSQDEAGSEPAEGDDLDALFASLRGGRETDERSAKPHSAGVDPHATENGVGTTDDPGTDWMAVRDARLLPITNRALRGVKKAMTEVQNVALDSLRTDEEWKPDKNAIAESVHAELVGVWTESFAVGHSVAEEMEGDHLKRPSTPNSKADVEFASDLAKAVSDALNNAGGGPRERQSAASRVFRVWRSDEAERRIRDIALLGYETGIEKSRRVHTG